MICKYCKKEFKRRLGGNQHYKGNYCSLNCYHKHRWNSKGVCKNCHKEIQQPLYCSDKCRKEYWNKNGYRLLTKYRNWQRKIELIKKLGGKCVACGISDIRVLDINHKDPTKKDRPSDGQYNWSRRLKEWNKNIDNIELLCANCHRIHTWKQRGFGLNTTQDMFVGLPHHNQG